MHKYREKANSIGIRQYIIAVPWKVMGKRISKLWTFTLIQWVANYICPRPFWQMLFCTSLHVVVLVVKRNQKSTQPQANWHAHTCTITLHTCTHLYHHTTHMHTLVPSHYTHAHTCTITLQHMHTLIPLPIHMYTTNTPLTYTHLHNTSSYTHTTYYAHVHTPLPIHMYTTHTTHEDINIITPRLHYTYVVHTHTPSYIHVHPFLNHMYIIHTPS